MACLQALIAAKLTFRELLQVVVPMTAWWKDRKIEEQLAKVSAKETLAQNISMLRECIKLQEDEDPEAQPLAHFSKLGALDRYVALWQ